MKTLIQRIAIQRFGNAARFEFMTEIRGLFTPAAVAGSRKIAAPADKMPSKALDVAERLIRKNKIQFVTIISVCPKTHNKLLYKYI
jgi:hypothetical protein